MLCKGRPSAVTLAAAAGVDVEEDEGAACDPLAATAVVGTRPAPGA